MRHHWSRGAAGVVVWLCLGCGEGDLQAPPLQEDISVVQVIPAGTVRLRAQGSVESIPIQGKTQAGGIRRLQMTPRGFLLVDRSSKAAYEYDDEGHPLRSFAAEELYDLHVCDADRAFGYSLESELLRFGPGPAPTASRPAPAGIHGVCDRNGDVLLLQKAERRTIPILTRYSGSSLEPLSTTAVGDSTTGILTCHVAHLFHTAYDPTRERLYYLGPGEYRVKEIDAATGAIVRTFGQRIPAYRPLAELYRAGGCGAMAASEAATDSTTQPMNLALLGSRYLMVAFANFMDKQATWQVFDLESGPPIRMYALSEEDAERLGRRRPLATRQDRLFVLHKPEIEQRFTSFGRVDSYSLVVPDASQ